MNYEVLLRLKTLAAEFPRYLQSFDERVPFAKPGQHEYHSETIALREELGSAATAIDDERFMKLLWQTLLAWGIGSRGSRLVPYQDFCHRQYTRVFFRCYGSQFQYGQRRFFEQAFRCLAELARNTVPAQYVGDGWRTSRTKVLDNALIAYCQENRLSLP